MTETQFVLSPETVEVGQGVTYGVGSDRYAATIVEVSKSGKTVSFTNDSYRAAEGSDYYGQQVYEYESTPVVESVSPMGESVSNVRTARWSAKHQAFMFFGRKLIPGRHAYSDPHF